MCDFSTMVMCEPPHKRGSGKKKTKDVAITVINKQGEPHFSISMSNEVLKRYDAPAKRIMIGYDGRYKNRIYIFFTETGYALCKSSKSRVSAQLRTKALPGINPNLLIGEYNIERDKNNHLFVALELKEDTKND